MKRTYLALLVSFGVLTGCGGGSGYSPAESYSALLEQVGTCVSVVAGTAPVSKFNAAADVVASTPKAEVCALWAPGLLVSCDAAYDLYSKPYAGQCVRP